LKLILYKLSKDFEIVRLSIANEKKCPLVDVDHQ